MRSILKVIPFFCLIISTSLWADTEKGNDLHDEKCSSCHMMESHEALYTRKDRVVDSLHRLGGQVSACTQALNIEWFPEEEKDVVEYLNKNYYHFKK